jgi:hypothetical protein
VSFPESRIAEEDYAPLVASIPGADPDDRHHTEAAGSRGSMMSQKVCPRQER